MFYTKIFQKFFECIEFSLNLTQWLYGDSEFYYLFFTRNFVKTTWSPTNYAVNWFDEKVFMWDLHKSAVKFSHLFLYFAIKMISRKVFTISFFFFFQDLICTTVLLTLIILITRIECIITIKQFICLEGMWTFNT